MSDSIDNDHTIPLRKASGDDASPSTAGPESRASDSPTGEPRPDALTLGPVDSPRFAVPPFSPSGRRPISQKNEQNTTVDDQSPEDPNLEDVPSKPHGDGSAALGTPDAASDEDDPPPPSAPEPDLDGPTGEDPTMKGGPDLPSPEEALDELEAEIDTELIDEAASRMASSSSVGTNDRVVEMLLRRGVVSVEAVEAAQAQRDAESPDVALWRVLAQQDDVDEDVVYERAARIYAFSVADLEVSDLDFVRSTVDTFTEDQQEQLFELGLVPHHVQREGGRQKVILVTHDPMRPEVHRVARSLDLSRFELQYAPKSVVNELLTEAFPKDNEYLERIDEESAVDLGQNFEEEEDLVDEEKLEEEINRSTLINLFEATLVEAVREGASDIHIYPNSDKEVEIHFRVDGRLNHWHTEDRVHPEALLSVIKDNAMSVDRFESDAAQDGFIQRDVDGTRIRYRVSIMPIASSNQDIDSESVVIRVLDDRKVITDLNKLGLGPRALERFEHAIQQPNGMVILTGPTGSGKSTTLVAALHRVIGPGENVLTIEDPVEYIIEGARQIKLSDKLRLKDALRSILRHDPDTVMVGEMRDKETAELAIKLANTGHLTFSTLHTNDAPSAVSRLYKMEIEPFLIAYAINLVVAQRLIRTLCPNCKQEVTNPDAVKLRQLGFSEEEIDSATFYAADDKGGCGQCGGTGYDGRRAIAEALYLTEPIRHMIVEAEGIVDEGAIREHAEQEDGMRSLQASARQSILNGETSVEEMIRVVAT
ncbi:GspE/PulE family protein [Salinibacter ruber]|uniref:GspE/PulE family protein n=1 Tax=Salinibacter ruber TaxID=146919 RepID=UPI0020745455|nr:GspE/PulE family protein [Salinibacter ruber]MCS4102148.1 type IV pilus assembly protein PilB [Salinibacter ruber]